MEEKTLAEQIFLFQLEMQKNFETLLKKQEYLNQRFDDHIKSDENILIDISTRLSNLEKKKKKAVNGSAREISI